MRYFSIGLPVLLFALLVGCKPNEPLSLTIAHINDTHSHFDEAVTPFLLPDASGAPAATYTQAGGFPRLASKIDQLRIDAFDDDKDFLLLHAGDAFSGTLFFTLFEGQLNADFMNLMEFDAMVIGNHEFDLGNEALAKFSDSVDFPLISANTKVKGVDPLNGAYLPLTIKMLRNKPVAIVGLTTEYTKIISSPGESVSFTEVQKTAKKAVKILQGHGINKIIFLTHLGLEEDRLLAQSVPGIDVIIGGHSPELLGDHSNIGLSAEWPSPVMERGPDGGSVCIMHSGEYSTSIGVTDVDFSGDGEVLSCAGQNVFLVGEVFAQGSPPRPVDALTQESIAGYIAENSNIEIVSKDPVAQSILDNAKLEVAAFASSVIGETSEPLYHVRLPGDLHPTAGVLQDGSMVAPHVAQSMADKMEETSGQPYVSIINGGGVRADLDGDITIGSAYSVLPFKSTLVSMSVTGESLLNTLKSNVSNAFLYSSVAFPYAANVRYTINLADQLDISVEDVQLLDLEGVYQPLDLTAQYNLVTTSYLARGGDFYQFEGATNIIDTGHIDAEAFVQYVQSEPAGVLNRPDSKILIIQ